MILQTRKIWFIISFFAILIILFLGFASAECVPAWDCTFGECINNITTKSCVELNNCNDNPTKPDVHGQTEECTIQKPRECIDNDYDGYGKGEDCFGKDLDDNNPLVTSKDWTKSTEKKINFVISLIHIRYPMLPLSPLLFSRRLNQPAASHPRLH